MASKIIPTMLTAGREIGVRAQNGVFAAQEAVNTLVQLVLAGLNGQADLYTSVLTGGTKSMHLAAANQETGFGKSLGKVYLNLLKVINPNAKKLKKEELGQRETFESAPGFLPAKQVPMGVYSVAKGQQAIMNYFVHSSWFINRQIIARFVAPLSSIVGIIAGFGNLAYGALNLAASVATLGTKPTPVTRTYHSLKSVGWMLNQLRQGVLGLYRPSLLSTPKPSLEVQATSEVKEGPNKAEKTA
jgi:hypothetical protein